MTKPLPLTILMLTHRRGEVFEQALASTQMAQSVIVIDNRSGNDWEQLEKKYRFTLVIHDEVISDFAAVRNQSLRHAPTEWVLFLDSDEVLPSQAWSKLEKLLKGTAYQAFTVTRTDVFLGKRLKHGEVASVKIVRLAKKSSLKFKRAVHETTAMMPREIGDSGIEIFHYSHDSIADFINRVTFYSKLDAQERTSGHVRNFLELLLYPPAKFITNFIFKMGFLDGWRGLVYAVVMSLHSLFVRIYRYELLHNTQL